MIQVLGIRTYEEYGRVKPYVTLDQKNWLFDSVPDFLSNYVEFLQKVDEDEKFNLMFTLANVEKGTARTFISQEIYPFDIDGIDTSRAEEYLDAVLPILGVTRDECTALMTGHGIHIYIQGEEFDSVEYFKEYREHYKLLTAKCNTALADRWLTGQCDNDMWSPARMGRVPCTINRKDYKGLPDTTVEVLCNNMKKIDFTLSSRLNLTVVRDNEQVSPKALKRLPKIDTTGVVEGCAFLRYCKDNQEKIVEPQWYAMLSVLVRLDNGDELCHEYSKLHPRYNAVDTQQKLEQAKLTAGPRTCENIESLWNGCKNCEHYNTCRSPVLIKGDLFIETESTGFRKIQVTKDGIAVPKEINYDDLLKYYDKLHNHITVAETGEVYTYCGTHWIPTTRLQLQAFVEDHVSPKPKGNERDEFVKKVLATNIRDQEFFDCQGYMNLKNGVFDLSHKLLMPHSEEHGFVNVIPYEYDASAKCPKFDSFMLDITQRDTSLEKVLLEYAGYSLSNSLPEYGEKAMILFGDGANGKSVFIDVIRTLAGEGNTSAITMADLSSETQRYQLVGKLFNVAEETPRKSLIESSAFKNLITGGVMTVKQLYKQPYSTKNKCKFIFACNDLPTTSDSSRGLFRRLLIVPFKASFIGLKANKRIREELYKEMSGILNRVIEGYDRLKAQEWHFTKSEQIDSEQEDFVNASTPTEYWFNDYILIDSSGALAGGDKIPNIYKAYRSDIELTFGHRAVLDANEFRAQLKRHILNRKPEIAWSDRYIPKRFKLRGVIVKGVPVSADYEAEGGESESSF